MNQRRNGERVRRINTDGQGFKRVGVAISIQAIKEYQYEQGLGVVLIARLQIGIITGNPGVFRGYPYPYPSLPVPGSWGSGLSVMGYGFFSHRRDTV